MSSTKKETDGIKICVITGTTSGIGKAVAVQLSKVNLKLFLLSRNISKGKAFADKTNNRYGIEKAKFIQTDMSNFKEVRSAANEIKEQERCVDILINNAGARFNDFKANEDGIELAFATNHLGHFLLTLLLLDRLKSSPEGRIINVASEAHRGYTADFDYIFNKHGYNRRSAYGRSKLATILFTYELERRLTHTKVTVNALCPGMVASKFSKNNGLISWARHIAYHLAKRELILPARAADKITCLALSDEVQGITGKYFSGKKEIRSSAASYDQNAGRKLWEVSLQLCGMEEVTV